MDELALAVRETRVGPDVLVCEEKELAAAVFFVLEGEMDILRTIRRNRESEDDKFFIKKSKNGDCLGETAFLAAIPY